MPKKPRKQPTVLWASKRATWRLTRPDDHNIVLERLHSPEKDGKDPYYLSFAFYSSVPRAVQGAAEKIATAEATDLKEWLDLYRMYLIRFKEAMGIDT